MVTLRVRDDVPRLRERRFIEELRTTLSTCRRQGFDVVHYSIQNDHFHLIVEADDHDQMGRGMMSLCIRIARAVNRVFDRTGKVLAGRYHVRWLKTPTEVRNALSYVLLNVRKHWRAARGAPPPVRLDEASSGRWFDGWRGGLRGIREGPREVTPPRTWLLAAGWKKKGLITPEAVPGGG